jgi:hypothetical protein
LSPLPITTHPPGRPAPGLPRPGDGRPRPVAAVRSATWQVLEKVICGVGGNCHFAGMVINERRKPFTLRRSSASARGNHACRRGRRSKVRLPELVYG